MTKKTGLVPVTVRAVLQRINRKLAPESQVVRKTRGSRAIQDLGEYYLLDWNRNVVLDSRVDVERLGRKLKLVGDWESVVAD